MERSDCSVSLRDSTYLDWVTPVAYHGGALGGFPARRGLSTISDLHGTPDSPSAAEAGVGRWGGHVRSQENPWVNRDMVVLSTFTGWLMMFNSWLIGNVSCLGINDEYCLMYININQFYWNAILIVIFMIDSWLTTMDTKSWPTLANCWFI